MDIERNYILFLLREIQGKILAQNGEKEAAQIGGIIRRISGADDVREILRQLYFVSGLDRFALRLLWLMDLVKAEGKTPTDSVAAYQVDKLLVHLSPIFQAKIQNNI